MFNALLLEICWILGSIKHLQNIWNQFIQLNLICCIRYKKHAFMSISNNEDKKIIIIGCDAGDETRRKLIVFHRCKLDKIIYNFKTVGKKFICSKRFRLRILKNRKTRILLRNFQKVLE